MFNRFQTRFIDDYENRFWYCGCDTWMSQRRMKERRLCWHVIVGRLIVFAVRVIGDPR